VGRQTAPRGLDLGKFGHWERGERAAFVALPNIP
jgi:hypothetical protein